MYFISGRVLVLFTSVYNPCLIEPFFIDFLTSHVFFTFQIVRFDMKLANEDVGMLAFTSEQIPAPFLLPEMVRP